MTFSEEKADGVLVLGVSGKINTEASAELSKRLNALTDRGERRLLLDFANVDYINSSGLRVLMTVARKLNDQGGKMVLAAVTKLIQQILRVSGCAAVIVIYTSRDEALKALKVEESI